jgi:tetraacyldisaccharide 4'-kinase
MNLQPTVHINKWLLPLAWLYRMIVCLRNRFFKWGIFKREEFDIPVICIGNIAVGGTGKTPHTEYIIRLLKDKYRVAVLSRGYGRKTSGFVLGDDDSTARTLGDEPYQIKRKFPDIIVAVDEKRTRGIKHLLDMDNPPEVVLLDDAFQHRYVKPSYNIVLSDFNRPLYLDELLPAGRLREPASYIKKANAVIVTKCPVNLQPIDYRIISHDMDLFPYQDLFFSSIVYKKLKPVFDSNLNDMPLEDLRGKSVLLVTGIAHPQTITEKIEAYTNKIDTMKYPDHYDFKKKDIQSITNRFNEIQSTNKIIVVTEKDASRLVFNTIDDDTKQYFYYLPIEIGFSDEEGEKKFNENILSHVRSYKANRIIFKK